MRKKRNLKERICALVLAFLMPLTSVLPSMGMVVQAEGTSKDVTFYVYETYLDENNVEQKLPISGAEIIVKDSEDAVQVVNGDGTVPVTSNEGKCTVTLPDDAKEYRYSVNKTGFTFNGGYEQTLSGVAGITEEILCNVAMNNIFLESSNSIVLNLSDESSRTSDVVIGDRIVNDNTAIDYQWTSDNKDVATADNGTITAVGKGTATIKVSRNGKEKAVAVTVKENMPALALTASPAGEVNLGTSTEVKFVLTNMPGDAAASVDVYKGDINNPDNKITTLEKSGNWEKTVSIDNLKGNVVFTAVYPEENNDYYFGAQASTSELSYKQSTALTVDTGLPSEITYGEKAPQIKVTDSVGEGVRTITYQADDSGVVTVDEQGNITVNKAGTAVITITADRENETEYMPATATYTLTVKKKAVDISLQNLTWTDTEGNTAISKVYDGTSAIGLVGTLSGNSAGSQASGVQSGDKITIPVEAVITKDETAAVDVGKYTTYSVKQPEKTGYENLGDNVNYEITITDTFENNLLALSNLTITVEPRSLYVMVARTDQDCETAVRYGQTKDEMNQAIADTNKVVFVNGTGKVDSAAENQGFADGETPDIALADYVDVVLDNPNGTYDVGTHSTAIKPEMKTGVDPVVGNYKICIDENNIGAYSGRLKVMQEVTSDEEIWNRVEIDTENSSGIYQADGTIWVRAGGKIAFKVKSEVSGYDQVWVKRSNDEVYSNVLTFSDITEVNNLILENASIYLSKDGQSNTRTTSSETGNNAANTIPKGAIRIDNKLPAASFGALGLYGLTNTLEGNLLFKAFTQGAYEANITVSDNGSGLKEAKYKTILVTETNTIEGIKTEALSDTGWKELSADAVNVPENPTEGYYVILVKVTDNVGNSAVYSSDGLVLDTTQGNVTINLQAPDQEIYGVNGAAYTITAEDNTGIQEIAVTVSTPEGVVESGDAAEYKDTYTLTAKMLDKLENITTMDGGYTFGQLSSKKNYSFEGSITAAACNSNHVTIKVVAKDMAGNEMSDERQIRIDGTKPEISVSYDDEGMGQDTCFQKRIMTIVYTERNFEEKNATFNLTVNQEKKQGVTLENLSTIEGISIVSKEDSQADRSAENYTDDRTNTYVIEFGKAAADIDFEIVPALADTAGNKNQGITYAAETVAESKFTVDQTEPTIQVSYDNNDVQNGKYFKAERTMTVDFTERNFDEELVTFDVSINNAGTENSIKEQRTLSAWLKEPENKENAVKLEKVESEGDVHTYKITFGADKKDIDYVIVPHITDKAGNSNGNIIYAENTAAEAEFTVDMIAPVITAEYCTVDETGKETGKAEVSTASRLYKNQTIQAVISIEERNFASDDTFADNINVIENAVDISGAGVDVTDQNSFVKDKTNWISDAADSDLKIQKLTFAEEANYEFNLTYCDMAGNKAVLRENNSADLFTVDKTAPSAKMTVSETAFEKFIDTVTFGFFSNDKITVKSEMADTTSPVKTSYYEHKPNVDIDETAHMDGKVQVLTKAELQGISEWITLAYEMYEPDDDGYINSKTAAADFYTIEKTSQIVPYEKVEDKAGNIAYLNADGIVCEDQESDVNISIITSDPETSFDVAEDEVVYNSDVIFTVTAADNVAGDIYSGLSKVSYVVYVGNDENAEGNVKGEITFDPTDRKQSYTTEEIKIPAEQYNSNDITIKATAIDNAGNVKNCWQKLKIDITNPTIAVSYDLNADEVKNEKYFNDNRVMTITYTERNINEEGLTFDFKAGGKDYSADGPITLAELKAAAKEAGLEISDGVDTQKDIDVTARTDARTLEYTIQFTGGTSEDMDYYIVPHIEDQASNKNVEDQDGEEVVVVQYDSTIANKEFTIDKVKPTMDVKYYVVGEDGSLEEITTSENLIERPYKNQTIRAVVTIDERNFSPDETSFNDQVIPHFSWKQNDGTAGSVADYENAATSRAAWTTDSENATLRTQTFDFEADRDEHRFDGDYSFNMEYTDLAGNPLEIAYKTHYFTVDSIVPEMEVVYSVDGKEVAAGEIEEERLYKNETITTTVTITERNFQREDSAEKFETGQMALTYEAVDHKDVKVTTEDYTEDADTRGKWAQDGYVRTQTFTFENDANYTLGLVYKDLAGNEVVYGTHYFTVDKTDPTGSIFVYSAEDKILKHWENFLNMVTFGIFGNFERKVTMTNDDQTAGVASMQYYKYVPNVESRYQFEGLTREQLEKLDKWEDGNIEKDTATWVKKEEQVIVYTKIVDRAGNVTYINSHEGIIVDDTDPTAPQITITTAEPAQGIYNQDVNFTLSVTDPVSGGTYSGLKSVSYEIRKNGELTQSGNYDAELKDWTARKQSLTKSATVNSQLNNSNDVTIKVMAEDYAGNYSEATKDIKIDTKDPEVTITFDLNNPSNGKYYNATRTATISVKERNFDVNAVNLTITNTDGTMPAVSGWSISPQAGVSDDAVNTCTVTFAADGDYTMAMSCTDKAGNDSNRVEVSEFTIDKTVPTINVSFDNNNVSNGRYYNAPRTATITVNEHNFNGSEVQTAISASLQSQGISAPGVNGWSTSGDAHTATVYFSADGDYSFTVNYTDLAGNAATTYSVEQFTVDQTKPEIEIFDIIDKSANNGTVAPGVSYSDVNYTADGVNITIKGAQHTTALLDGTRTSIANGESIKMADFEHEESVDDVYTLTAQVTDLAGNSDEKSVTFSVNRFGSNYIFSEETKEYLDPENKYHNKEQDLVVTEINVDTLEHRGISYGRDGDLVNLEEGSDYTVKESGSEVSWKSYQYRIKAENFAEEGHYNVTIDSLDRATNEVNNKVKDANIEFVIDKTAPTVVITGIEDDAQYRENSRDVGITVADNIAIGEMDVYLDENLVKNYPADVIQTQRGEIVYTMDSSTNWQRISAVATDAAGNTAETSEYRILITSNLLVQFYRNTPLVIGSSISLLAVIAVLILLIGKRRKKEEEA